jgi:hypothetical protein
VLFVRTVSSISAHHLRKLKLITKIEMSKIINLLRKKGINPQTKETIYYLQWTRKETDTVIELSEELEDSTFSQGECVGLMIDFPKRIARSLIRGNAAYVQGLGTFKLKVSGKAKKKPEELTTKGCTVEVLFEVDDLFLAKLVGAKFKIVEKATSDGKQDEEDEENNSIVIDSSTGDETPVDTSTNTTVDTSTGTTVDTSTGTIDNNSGDDIPAGNG